MLNERGASANTITAYRDASVLLLNFIQQVKRIKPEKLTLDKIKKETIIEFLTWLQRERICSNTTRNARLAAIHSFYRYLQHQDLSNFHEVQKILSIRFKKKSQVAIKYLTVEGMKLLLKQPEMTKSKGRRDLALLSLLYDSGAMVQEVIDLTPSSLRLGKPATIKIIGKANKARLVPKPDAQVEFLKSYLKENC